MELKSCCADGAPPRRIDLPDRWADTTDRETIQRSFDLGSLRIYALGWWVKASCHHLRKELCYSEGIVNHPPPRMFCRWWRSDLLTKRDQFSFVVAGGLMGLPMSIIFIFQFGKCAIASLARPLARVINKWVAHDWLPAGRHTHHPRGAGCKQFAGWTSLIWPLLFSFWGTSRLGVGDSKCPNWMRSCIAKKFYTVLV